MSCECPHRLSDKLLKSVATYAAVAGLLRCCEAAYITLFTSEVKHLFFNFLLSFSLSARLSACCSVSVGCIIGSRFQKTSVNFRISDCLLHSTAKPLFIPGYTQSYPQTVKNHKIRKHHANVCVTISTINDLLIFAPGFEILCNNRVSPALHSHF